MKFPRAPWRCLALVFVPGVAAAHFFTQPYTLPVPFSMYAFGATAALLLSFAIVGVFASVPAFAVAAPTDASVATDAASARGSAGLRIARTASVLLLAFCIVTGLFGVQNPFANFSMTFFWIVFVLGVPYAVALAGDFYVAINPWRVIVDWLERHARIAVSGRQPYPTRLGYYPALALYMVFIWLELFGQLSPAALAIALLVYTAANVWGAWNFGKQDWFRYCEFFGVFMRLLGRMSPWARSWDPAAPSAPSARRWRYPFIGLLTVEAEHMSLVVFILFMLSSTAFDGLHSTLPFVNLYWKGIYPVIAPWFTPTPGQEFVLSTDLYYFWQWCSLVISPFVYLAVFFAFVAAMKAITGPALPLRTLVLRFAMALVPIAFVYHVTHYYTLLLAQAGQLVRQISDPFGFQWNIFGTALLRIDPLLVDIGVIWHTQVALILIGHIASVYLAHVEALRTFGTARRAAVSQLPMLLLMMLFTTFGLWILSLPLAAAG